MTNEMLRLTQHLPMNHQYSVLQRLPMGARADWIRAHIDYPHEDYCLIWPFGSSFTEGTIQVGRPGQNVCRVMCEYRNGPPPTEKHQAAHSCGRRHEGCVNPHHLSWKTNSENQIERYQHSGFVPSAKLKTEQIDEIKSLKGRVKVKDVAKLFGVSPNTIRSIFDGKLWDNTLTIKRRVFTEDEVRLIRGSNKMIKTLAEEFGVHKNVIMRMRAGATYKYVEAAE